MYIDRNREAYREDSLRPGDIVGTFHVNTSEISYIVMRQLFLLLGGYHCFHAGVVVRYKNRLYILHGNPKGALIGSRKGKPYADQIETMRTFSKWDICLEPLECFIAAEKENNSILTVIRTGKDLEYHAESVQSIQGGDSMLSNCCFLLGKYLDREGVCTNSLYVHDALCYTPTYFLNYFGNLREIQL